MSAGQDAVRREQSLGERRISSAGQRLPTISRPAPAPAAASGGNGAATSPATRYPSRGAARPAAIDRRSSRTGLPPCADRSSGPEDQQLIPAQQAADGVLRRSTIRSHRVPKVSPSSARQWPWRGCLTRVKVLTT